MADIRNIRPFGSTPPDKIFRCINGKAVEIKKAYHCVNGQLAVVWNIGSEPHPYEPDEFVVIFRNDDISFIASFPQIEVQGQSHAGRVDWGDGSDKDYYWSNNSISHQYAESGEYKVVVKCDIAQIRDYSSYSSLFLNQNMKEILRFPDTMKRIGNWSFPRAYLKQDTLDFNKVEEIGNYAFHNPDYGKASNEITNLVGDSVKTIGIGAFAYHESLLSIDFKTIETLPSSCFEYCKNLRDINLPHVVRIGQNAFRGCTSLESVEFQSSLATLHDYCFYHCDNLRSITMSINDIYMQTIMPYAFSYTSLTDIYYHGRMTDWFAVTLRNGWNYYCGSGKIVVHCSDGEYIEYTGYPNPNFKN